jgi:5-methylcytosine-specific restriction endonuclease McrA
VTRTEAKRLKLMRSIEDVHALADRYLSEARAAKARLRSRPRSEPSRKERKEASREERNERTGLVRAEVWRRSGAIMLGGMLVGGCCEACGVEMASGGELDHWLGGSSRRRETTPEGTWRLCPMCHHDKTNAGGPGSSALEFWNERRRAFCEKNGIPFVPRKPTRYYAKETP